MSLEKLESRVNNLEKQNRFLKGAFALLAIAGISVAAAAPEFSDTLTLKSPNGKNTITLQATDRISGLWLSRESVYGPSVAIYNDKSQGAVVGVWGDHSKDKKMIALDVAISAGRSEDENLARLQAVDANGNVHSKTVLSLVK